MSEKELGIGNKVKVIGPSIDGKIGSMGHVFTIYQMFTNYQDIELYTNNGRECYYPASSLQSVSEEMKAGDWVKIVGSDCFGILRSRDPEKVYKIFTKTDSGHFQIWGIGFYPAISLRKLTPEEIPQHQSNQMPAKLDEIQELRRRIHDLEMSMNGFTNGPEPEYVCGISYVKNPIRDRLYDIEKKLNACQKNEAPEIADCVKVSNAFYKSLNMPTRITCPNAQFDPRAKCMFCGIGSRLCHANLIHEACPLVNGRLATDDEELGAV